MHQSVYELVHTEDQQELRRNLHWALNPPAAASTSSQDSPQGDSLFPHQVLDQGSPVRPLPNDEIEAVLHSRAWKELREIIYVLLILLMYNSGPSNTKLIFTAAHGEFCLLKIRRRTVSDK